MADTETDDPTISRRAALDAAKAGGQAYRDGQDPSDCPYGVTNLGQEFLAHHWAKGYRIAAE